MSIYVLYTGKGFKDEGRPPNTDKKVHWYGRGKDGRGGGGVAG